MQYKPAYMVTNNGKTNAFVGNYDSLEDVKSDYPSRTFECWTGKDAFFVRVLTPEEFREKQRLHKLFCKQRA